MNDTSAQIQDFLLLQRVAQRISSILDLDDLLEQIVDDVARTFGYSRTGVLFLDEDRRELEIVAVRGWTTNFHLKGDRFPLAYGMVGRAATLGETYYVPDVSVDPFYEISEPTTRSEVDIPIRSRGRMIGIFNAQHAEVDAFPPHRIQLLEALAGHVGVAIENARMFERERIENERMLRDLTEARAIQSRLFPERAPEIPGFLLSGISRPCLEVGGDWYDYIPLPGDRIGIVLGDVAGKGSAAALLMASTRSILRLHAERDDPPSSILTQVSQLLRIDLPAARFITMIYAVLDVARGRIDYVNAGHNPPVLVDRSGARLLRTQPELPLGIGNRGYTDHVVHLEPGGRFVLYSDGVVEARSPSRDDYGEDRLLKWVARKDATVESLLTDVEAHAAGHPLEDDVTMVMIEH